MIIYLGCEQPISNTSGKEAIIITNRYSRNVTFSLKLTNQNGNFRRSLDIKYQINELIITTNSNSAGSFIRVRTFLLRRKSDYGFILGTEVTDSPLEYPAFQFCQLD
jgi:hypothetical protein